MDKKKLISVLVIAGIILTIGIISAFILLGGKEETTQPKENEGVVVDIDKKDRNEDEIKDDFEEAINKEREKRPVGIVDLPENVNTESGGSEIVASNIKEEVIGDKKIYKS